MRTRQQIKKEISDKKETIDTLKNEIDILKKEGMLLSDDKQRFTEEYVDVVINKRPKVIEKKLIGHIHWFEKFLDESDGTLLTIERKKVVRVNGKWIT